MMNLDLTIVRRENFGRALSAAQMEIFFCGVCHLDHLLRDCLEVRME